MAPKSKPHAIKKQINKYQKQLLTLAKDPKKYIKYYSSGQTEVEVCSTLCIPKSIHDALKYQDVGYALVVEQALDASVAYWDKIARESTSSEDDAWRAIYTAKRLQMDEARHALSTAPLQDLQITVVFEGVD